NLNGGTNNLRMGIVEFSKFAEVRQAITADQFLLSIGIDNMKNITKGATDIVDGMYMAKKQFDYYSEANNTENSKRRKIVVLLTDGKDSTGHIGEEIEAFAKGLNSTTLTTEADIYNQITLHTISISNDANTEMLKRLAEITGGSYFAIDGNSSDQTYRNQQATQIYEKLIKYLYLKNITALPVEAKINADLLLSEKYKGLDYNNARSLYLKSNVNILTGNFIQNITDIKLDNPAISLLLERTYNSDSGNEKTIIGNGWRLNYDTKIRIMESGTYATVTASTLNVRDPQSMNIITSLSNGAKVKYIQKNINGTNWHSVMTSDGRTGLVSASGVQDVPDNSVEVTYGSGTKAVFDFESSTPDGSLWTYKPPYGIFDRFIKTNNYYYLTKKDQTTYAYKLSGELDYIMDKNGNGINVTYDQSGKITTVTDNFGRTLQFQYLQDKLYRVTDPLNRYIEFTYNGNGNLIKFTNLEGKSTIYDYYDYYTTPTNAFKGSRLKKITDANGNQTIKNDYDVYGRLVIQYDANNIAKYNIYKDVFIDENTNTIIGNNELLRYFIDENGYVSKMQFNIAEKRPVVETDAYGDVSSHQYFIDYNENGSFGDFAEDVTYLTGTAEATAEYQQYLAGTATGNKPCKEIIIDKKGNKTYYENDKYGNLKKVTDANNDVISMNYDSYDNLIEKIDKKGNVSQYIYETVNSPHPDDKRVYTRMQKEINSLGDETVYEYFNMGERSPDDAFGVVVQGLCKKITQNKKNISGTLINDFKTTEYQYWDAANNLTKIKDSLGNAIINEYDVAGRLKKTTDARAGIKSYTYDSMNRIVTEEDQLTNKTTTKYDAVGNRISVTNKRGFATTYLYNAKNQLTSIVDPLKNVGTFKYDACGNKIEETDKRGFKTQYEYDYLGRLTARIDALGGTTTYSYDKAGNTKEILNAENIKTVFDYDNLNRKTKEDTVILGSVSKSISYQYDKNDNLFKIIDPKGNITKYDYDVLNRKISQIEGFTDGYGKDGNGFFTGPKDIKGEYTGNIETIFSYDISAEKTEKIMATTPGKFTTTKEYNALGQLTTEIDQENNSKNYEYDVVGNLVKTTNSKGFATISEYDIVGNLIKSTDPLGNYTRFEYDQEGNKTVLIDKRRNRTDYVYDANNKL
ncbi:MAG: hypothetical protein C0412_17250, partial [Flavobacterium sp.]|nr:hypothetical protein [Flavobacterium sp.]